MDTTLTIGLPRAMLYYRWQVLWKAFFKELNVNTVVSPPTDRQILEDGTALAIDEACLSLKIYLGHVKALIGQCDYILIPWVFGFGRKRDMCTRFQALPDLTRNIFRDSGQKFLTYPIDVLQKKDEESAFLAMGESLGFKAKAVKKAYRRARKADQHLYRKAVDAQEKLYGAPGLRILVAAHSYVVQDAYIGKVVMETLKKLECTPIRADLVNREEALKHSVEISPTCKWEISREILGSVAMHKDKVDGIVILSAFPCGPDSMTSEILTRRIHGIPLLNLVLDSQTGTAGVETRLESFVDIIRLKKGVL